MIKSFLVITNELTDYSLILQGENIDVARLDETEIINEIDQLRF